MVLRNRRSDNGVVHSEVRYAPSGAVLGLAARKSMSPTVLARAVLAALASFGSKKKPGRLIGTGHVTSEAWRRSDSLGAES